MLNSMLHGHSPFPLPCFITSPHPISPALLGGASAALATTPSSPPQCLACIVSPQAGGSGGAAGGGAVAEQQRHEGRLWSNLFAFNVELGRYGEAYVAATSNPLPPQALDCLTRLVNVLCEERQVRPSTRPAAPVRAVTCAGRPRRLGGAECVRRPSAHRRASWERHGAVLCCAEVPQPLISTALSHSS